MPTDDLPRLWVLRDLAEHTGVSEKTLQRRIAAGDGPPLIRIGRAIRFRPADVAAWVDQLAAERAA